jgi:hypothetical protein
MELTNSTVLPTNEAADFYSGFDQEDNNLRSKRLANRDAFMKYADQMSANGKTMGVDDWAALSKDILGPGAWMNVTNPSEQAMTQMASQQAASAQQKAEEIRRSQFKSDQEEKASILSDIHDQATSGKTPAELVQYAQDRYGPDLMNKLNLNFDAEHQKANFEAQTAGFQHGKSMYQTVDDAKAALDGQDWMPQVKKDSIIAGAQANQQVLESKILDLGRARGTTGFLNNEIDQVALRDGIRQLFPNASKDQEDAYLKMATQAAVQSKQAADATNTEAVTQKTRLSIAENAPQEQMKIVAMREAEDATRAAAEKATTQQLMGGVDRQRVMAQEIAKMGTKATDVDKEVEAGLQTFVFADPSAYENAVRSKNRALVESIKKESPTIADVTARAESLGKLMRYDFRGDGNRALDAVANSGLGASSQQIQNMGLEIKKQTAIAEQSPTLSLFQRNPRATYLGKYGPVSKTLPSSGATADIQKTAQQQVDHLNQSFIDGVATEVSQLRTVLQTNTTIGMKSEDLASREEGMVRQRVRSLLKGMGLGADNDRKSYAIEQGMVNKILAKAGTAPTLTAIPSRVDAYVTGVYNSRLDAAGMPQTNGTVIPGSALPSPRASAPAGGWAPANF